MESFVDFELGEDVRGEVRLAQDREWAGAVADGRAHVSHREFSILYRKEFMQATVHFHIVEALVDAISNLNNMSSIRKVSPEILRIIIDYAFPGQGLLVCALIY